MRTSPPDPRLPRSHGIIAAVILAAFLTPGAGAAPADSTGAPVVAPAAAPVPADTTRRPAAPADSIPPAPTPAAPAATGPDFNHALDLYYQNRLPEARPLLRRVVATDSLNAEALATLADICRRQGERDSALVFARRALRADSCHAFAYCVLSDLYNPQFGDGSTASADSSWSFVLKAVACDSLRADAWMTIWVGAQRKGDEVLEKRAVEMMSKAGFVSAPIRAYTLWTLRRLPDKAVFLANGDLDTYPGVILQQMEAFRPDVAIVNLSLLNLPWYLRRVRDRYGLPLPVADSLLDAMAPRRQESGGPLTVSRQVVQYWLGLQKGGQFPRPIAVALSVPDVEFTPDSKSRAVFAGSHFRMEPAPAAGRDDTLSTRLSLADIRPEDLDGPVESPRDHSPVRRASARMLVSNVVAANLRYAFAMLAADRTAEARDAADRAEMLAGRLGVSDRYADYIGRLRGELARRKPAGPGQPGH